MKLCTGRSTIGASAGEVHLFYVEVEDHMRKTKGGLKIIFHCRREK